MLAGVTTDADWNNRIRHLPAPWAEIEVPGQIILTVPTRSVFGVTDMNRLASIYSDIMIWINTFASIGIRQRTERFVFDVQISAGQLKTFRSVMILYIKLFS